MENTSEKPDTNYTAELRFLRISTSTLTVWKITKFEKYGFILRVLFKLKLSLYSAMFCDTEIKFL